MSDYYSDLDRIKKAGHQHALDHMANGAVEPEEALFSGEWADGLTGQDAINYAGIKECTFSDLEDYEQTDVMDSFEDGYNSAPWPADLEVEQPADFDHSPDGWEDYALACDAVHAANPHRFEGEL